MTNGLRNKDGPLGNSFRDPSGFVYKKKGIIYRQINQSYRSTFELFIASGLYTDLVASGDLIPHDMVADEEMQTEQGWRIIRPEHVCFWSYPYEWCFSQLKEAAIMTLRVQQKALKYGMSMKDGSAFNIQFINGKPVLIDSLSFEKFNPAKGWQGFRQFCMHFLAPLALMSMGDHRLGQLLRCNIDGIPLELTSSLLPWKSWLHFSTLFHIHLQVKAERRYLKKTKVIFGSHTIDARRVVALVKQLESAINRLEVRPSSSWVDYYATTERQQEALLEKDRVVGTYLAMVAPRTVWDFGANDGRFSRLAAKQSQTVISFDFDLACVEMSYRKCKSAGYTNILPLCLDLTNPSGRMGWGNDETMSLSDRSPTDLILCLALIHHLAIGKNIPFDRVARWLSTLTTHLIIEFVPKCDPMVQRMLRRRDDIFPDYDEKSFELIFSRYFRIIESEKISCTSRMIYLMKSMVSNT